MAQTAAHRVVPEPASVGIPPAGERRFSGSDGTLVAALEQMVMTTPLREAVATLTGLPRAPRDPAEALKRLATVGRIRSMLDGLEAALLADGGEMVQRKIQNPPDSGLEGHGYPISSYHLGLNRSSFVAEAAQVLRVSEKAAHSKAAVADALRHVHPKSLALPWAGTMTGRAASNLVRQTHGLPADSARRIEADVLPFAPSANDASMARRTKRRRERLHPESIADRRDRAAPAEDVLAIYNTVSTHAQSLQGPDERRRVGQLRADSLIDALLDGWPGNPACNRSGGVTLTLPAIEAVTNRERGTAELEGYGPIPIDAALRIAAKAPSLKRMLTDPWDGAILDIGRKKYKPRKALRDLLRARDHRCGLAGCNRTPDESEVDHIEDWAKGGTTSLENTWYLCKRHQVYKHVLGWDVVHRGNGTVESRSPNGVLSVRETEPTQPPATEQLAEDFAAIGDLPLITASTRAALCLTAEDGFAYGEIPDGPPREDRERKLDFKPPGYNLRGRRATPG